MNKAIGLPRTQKSRFCGEIW